jgi:outer membrane protein assembly factor BamD
LLLLGFSKINVRSSEYKKAIDALQLFVNLYPESERSKEAADLIQKLRDKLELKAFANARLYYDMGLTDDYRAAVIALQNVLKEYPDTKYAEEIEFLTLKAQYIYASKSFFLKQESRFDDALTIIVASQVIFRIANI